MIITKFLSVTITASLKIVQNQPIPPSRSRTKKTLSHKHFILQTKLFETFDRSNIPFQQLLLSK